MVNFEIIATHFCRSDRRIATQPTDSGESEFPPTTENVLLILKKHNVGRESEFPPTYQM